MYKFDKINICTYDSQFIDRLKDLRDELYCGAVNVRIENPQIVRRFGNDVVRLDVVWLIAQVILSMHTSTYSCMSTWAILKVMKFSYFRQSVFNKILAPDVFVYGDSKSESWHRDKKIRDIFMVNKSPRALLSVMENRVCFDRRFKTIIKIT